MENDNGSQIIIQKPPKKLYYSRRQAAEMVGVTTGQIKDWEKDFPQLKPVRNHAGNRYYTEKDVLLLFRIKELLLVKKMSIEKAQSELKKFQHDVEENGIIQLKQTLAEVKMEIREILELLEN